MNESEVKVAVEKLISDNKLDAQIVEINQEYDDEIYRVQVEVGRQDFDRVFILDNYFNDYSILWSQRTPSLVGAEVGDLVLIYCDRHADDKDSDVGLVSSKFTEEDGKVYYGCQYLKVGLNDQFVNSMYDFELTSENYGGFPEGFLRVLTHQEVISHLQEQLKVAFDKEQEKTRARFERSNKNLDLLVKALGNVKKINCEKVELVEQPYQLSLKTT